MVIRRTFLILIFVCLGVISCGQLKGKRFCVAGFGQCEFEAAESSDSSSSTSSLSLAASAAYVTLNNTVTFTASGGTSPYTYSLVNSGIGTLDSTGVYTAPGTLTTSPTTITVKVVDSSAEQTAAYASVVVQIE